MQPPQACSSVPGMRRILVAMTCCLATNLVGGCHSEAPTVCPGSETTEPLVCERPVSVMKPPSYREDQRYPLLIALHGYASTVEGFDRLLGLRQAAAQRDFLFAAPEGTLDESNLRFWNATDGCCNLFGATVDDSAYLAAILRDLKRRFPVDPKRIYVVGHSNGGFMAYRFACEHAEDLAAVVSIAGATWNDDSKCRPVSPVSVLQVHGDQDGIIRYEGGRFAAQLELYPAARETLTKWSKYSGCTGGLSRLPETFDFDSNVDGDESQVEQAAACPQSALELWALRGGEHFPAFTATFVERLFGFLQAHPKSSAPAP